MQKPAVPPFELKRDWGCIAMARFKACWISPDLMGRWDIKKGTQLCDLQAWPSRWAWGKMHTRAQGMRDQELHGQKWLQKLIDNSVGIDCLPPRQTLMHLGLGCPGECWNVGEMCGSLVLIFSWDCSDGNLGQGPTTLSASWPTTWSLLCELHDAPGTSLNFHSYELLLLTLVACLVYVVWSGKTGYCRHLEGGHTAEESGLYNLENKRN